ncbi:hypothetical protein ACE1TF_17675 [Geomicrobium sp. JSM 1781026]|uniref:hypothetical protein n=1 Tax=Geomicrobium sp. JSM 1781026 TaxID=3344580 RepID=UPI0035BFEA90
MTAEESFILGILAFLGVFIVVIFIMAIVLYLFLAFGLFKMGQREGIDYAWLAFIPYAQYYLLAVLVKDRLGSGMREALPWILIGLMAANFMFGFISSFIPFAFIITIPLGLALTGFTLFAFFHLFKKYSDSYVVMFVFTILTLGALGSIFTFVIRNNEKRLDGAAV